tara:strand:+ start:393 stop:764 length:372 start_codon:yes stop_codon:yes gene_type:complete
MDTKEIKGKVDYDFDNDILFFKLSGRKYSKSIEIEYIVLDIDKKGLITGIQIFEASKFLNLNKEALLKIPNWEFQVKIKEERMELRLVFQIEFRNKIIEKNPIILEHLSEPLPNSELICKATS